MAQTQISKALWSVESAKAVKAQEYGYLNAIHYMSPHEIAGVGNLCPWATPSCKRICLGYHSGQASMVANSADTNSKNNVRRSRDTKARQYMLERRRYMAEVVRQAARVIRKASEKGFLAALRFNGSTDLVGEAVNLAHTFPTVKVNEYTKSFKFAMANALGEHPSNLRVCFSRTEENEDDAIKILENGGLVSVVFAKTLPRTWGGFPVVDGDRHDLLHLWPRGVVIGLKAKGSARGDTSGFVVR